MRRRLPRPGCAAAAAPLRQTRRPWPCSLAPMTLGRRIYRGTWAAIVLVGPGQEFLPDCIGGSWKRYGWRRILAVTVGTKLLSPINTTLLAVVILFCGFLATLSASGLFTLDGTESSAHVVGAALALSGAFIAALVSVTGILFKHAFDNRAEARLQIEADRTEVMRREAEGRLKLEAAIRAIELFSRTADGGSAALQRAGALLTLSSLGLHEPTVSLLIDLLSRREVEPITAARLLNRAIVEGDETMQEEVARVLDDFADRMLTPYGFEFPRSLLKHPERVSHYSRMWSGFALAKV
jgi:hypothetical protein